MTLFATNPRERRTRPRRHHDPARRAGSAAMGIVVRVIATITRVTVGTLAVAVLVLNVAGVG
jgi:hypothetical protein